MSTVKSAMDLASSLRTKSAIVGPDSISVDPFYEEDSKNAKYIEYAIKTKKNILITGPTGCGKSSLAIHIAAKMGMMLEIINISGDTNVDKIEGKLLLDSKEGHSVTSVAYGPAPRAYRSGRGLLVEELGMGSPDVLSCLQRYFEVNSNFVNLDIGVGETIKRHPNFFVIATSNDTGWGEESFMYAGIKPMNQSLMNRFISIKSDYLSPDKETKVLCAKTGIDKTLAGKLVKVAGDVRKARKAATDRVVTVVSTRELLEWADIMNGIPGVSALESAEVAFLNKAPEAEYPIIKRFIENVFAGR